MAFSTFSSVIPFWRTVSTSCLRNPLCLYESSIGLISGAKYGDKKYIGLLILFSNFSNHFITFNRLHMAHILNEEEVLAFHRDGYVIVKNFFAKEEIDKLY